MHIEGGEEPPEICRAPPYSPALERYVTAFRHLTRDRASGMGIGPIPTSAIIVYAKEVDGETEALELRSYLRFVGAIDDEYVKACRAKAPEDPCG
jgi:hypothetical protein